MNLTETSKWFKKFVFYVGGFVISYYILILVIIPSFQYALFLIIPDSNPPTYAYGQKLPPLEFIKKDIVGSPNYQLNTTTGKLPTNLPTRAKVFQIKSSSFTYASGQSAQTDATLLGFTESDLITDLKGSTYKWRNLQTGGTLSIDINSRKLTMDTILGDKKDFIDVGFYTNETAVETASTLLDSLGRFDTSYEEGSNVIYKGKYLGTKVVQTEDIANAAFYRIDFFRQISDGKSFYPIKGPDPKVGLLHLYVSRDINEKGSYQQQYTPITFPVMNLYYNDINKTSDATYPLADINLVWDAVKSGKGIIANVSPKGQNPFSEYSPVSVDTILVNNIYLAYYEMPENQKYLQPVYVFEGNYKSAGTQGGDITIYFPAIKGENVESIK